MEQERLVKIKLFGQEFSFYTDASEEDVKRTIEMVRRELGAEEKGKHSPLPSNKMLVLGCLKIAARCIQLETEFDAFRKNQDDSIDKLIDKVSSNI